MKTNGALLLTSFGFACAMPESFDQARSAIVGGTDDFTSVAVVEVLVDGEGECTGAIVSPHVILTAAHCIAEADAGAVFAVFTGQDDARRDQGELVNASAAHVHPAYDPQTDEGDMAVLILERALAIPALAYNRFTMSNLLIGQPARIVGYGDNTVREPTSGFGRRRQATSPLIDFDTEWVVVGELQANQCYGDSGGPVLMTINGVETIVGVNSWQENDDCDAENYNTRIDTYVAFIDQHVLASDPPQADAGFAPDAEPAPDAGSMPDAGFVPDAGFAPGAEPAQPPADAGARASRDAAQAPVVLEDGCTCVGGGPAPLSSAGLVAIGACVWAVRRRSRR